MVLPVQDAARLCYIDQHWIRKQCDMGKLISTKCAGVWFVAITRVSNSPANVVTRQAVHDTMNRKTHDRSVAP